MVDTNAVFKQAHRACQKLLRELIGHLMDALNDFGCAYLSDREVFATKLRKVMLALVSCDADEAPLSTFRLSGTTREKREALIEEVLMGFGATDSQADKLTRVVLDTNTDVLARVTVEGGIQVRRPRFDALTLRIASLHRTALELHGRLKEILEKVDEPYRGTAADPDAGVTQVYDLLKRFPDVSDAIYQKLGYTKITSFPPEPIGVAFGAERIFMDELKAHADSEWWWEAFEIAGIVVASIAITVITAGTLGPLAATLVGSAIGLSQGIAQVVSADHKLQQTKDAHRFGAATDASVQHAEGELQGAWGMLIVNTATGGMIGRFGGGSTVTNAMKMLRISGISGVGNALATATNPNVWRAENTASLILFATVVGGASGAGGHMVAQGLARVFPALGGKVQIGVSKLNGHLRKGNKVTVQLRADEAPVSAKVVAVNKADGTVTLGVEGQNLRVRVGKIVKVQGSVFHDDHDALLPLTEKDVHDWARPAYRLRKGRKPELGSVYRKDGKILFAGDAPHPQPIRVEELRILNTAKFGRMKSMPKKDVELLQYSAPRHQIAKIPNRKHYYTAINHRRCYGQPKLTIIPGARRDKNGAFRQWSFEGLPKFDLRNMRGKGLPNPDPDNVALFMAHGSPYDFKGMSTNKAARTMVDAIVDTNTRTTTSNPIRYCALSSCMQGNRRFIFMGKTNAEAFQKHVDVRLIELGINPKGPRGITVLASDRMGSLIGADTVPTLGVPKAKTTFVPAGSQKPLAHPRDVVYLGVSATKEIGREMFKQIKVVGIVLVAAATGALMVVAVKDPEEAYAIIARLGKRIVALICDAPTQPHGNATQPSRSAYGY